MHPRNQHKGFLMNHCVHESIDLSCIGQSTHVPVDLGQLVLLAQRGNDLSDDADSNFFGRLGPNLDADGGVNAG